jgi:hypothetical protein
MSSSRSGQWTPSPRPIKRQFARSAGVPCARRGYQGKGTLTLRPSTRSTIKVSSVTVTCCAIADRKSLGEVLIPRSTKLYSVVSHHRLHPANLGPAKAAAPGQPYWIKPELGSVRISLHMHVPWFVSVSRVEKQPIGSAPEDRRHGDNCKPASPVRSPLVSLTLRISGGV